MRESLIVALDHSYGHGGTTDLLLIEQPLLAKPHKPPAKQFFVRAMDAATLDQRFGSMTFAGCLKCAQLNQRRTNIRVGEPA